MACQNGEFAHSRLLPPNDYLVLAVAVGTDQFVDILRVREVAHLTTGVDPVERLAGQGVPEANATVGGAATGAHHSVLVRRPSDRLDRRLMLAESDMRLTVVVP